ncbi:uncharacterized protein DEA37_0002492, partial [Paragonimus westermani]
LLSSGSNSKLTQSKSFPAWSPAISLDKRGVDMLQLKVIGSNNNRPDLVYHVGFEVREGHGRHAITTVVTFRPRYVIENWCGPRVQVAQRGCVQTRLGDSAILTLDQGCSQAFHWPRDDLDRFLCVRALLNGSTSLSQHVASTEQTCSTWSGGFQIDRPYAFTVMLRLPTSSKLVKTPHSDISNSDGLLNTLLNRLFLRIVILLRAATFHVRIEDANALPPPFRLENMSYVALSYQQVTSTLLTPENSSVTVTGTPSLRRARRIGRRTHSRSEQQRLSTSELDGDSLTDIGVENVESEKSWPGGGAVLSYLSPQTSTPYALEEPQYAPTMMLHVQIPGRRAQLWWLSDAGLVFHEGSSSPLEPGERASGKFQPSRQFVLDVDIQDSSDVRSSTSRGERGPFRVDADTARQFDVAQLIVAPVNKRRKHLQTWRIDQLTAKPEYLATGNLALSQKTSALSLCDHSQFRVFVSLPLGVGVSVVSMFAEELVYASLFNLRLSFSRAYSLDVFDRVAVQEALEPDSPPAGGLNVAGDVLLGSGTARTDATPIGESNDTVAFEAADLMNNWVEVDSGFQPCTPQDSLSDFVRLDLGYVQINSQFPAASLPILLFTDTSANDSSVSNSRSANSSRRSDDCALSSQAFRSSTLTITFQREVQQRWMVHLFKTMQININPVVILAEELLLLKLIQFWQHATCVSPLPRDLSLGFFATSDERVHPRPSDSSIAMDKGPLFWFDRFTISAVPLKLSVQTAKKSLTSSNLAGAKRLLPSLMSFTNAEVRLEPLVRAHVLETGSYFIDYLVTHYQLQLRAHAVHIFGSVDFLGNPIGLINDLTSGISGLVELDVGSLIRHVAHGVGDSTAKGFVYGVGRGLLGTVTKPLGGLFDLVSGAMTSLSEVTRFSAEGQPRCRIRPRRSGLSDYALFPLTSYRLDEAIAFLQLHNLTLFTSARQTPHSVTHCLELEIGEEVRVGEEEGELLQVDQLATETNVHVARPTETLDPVSRIIHTTVDGAWLSHTFHYPECVFHVLPVQETGVVAILTDRAVWCVSDRSLRAWTSSKLGDVSDNHPTFCLTEHATLLFMLPYHRLDRACIRSAYVRSADLTPHPATSVYVVFTGDSGASNQQLRCDNLSWALQLTSLTRETQFRFVQAALCLFRSDSISTRHSNRHGGVPLIQGHPFGLAHAPLQL